MEDKQKTDPTDDLASRIEKTLTQREQERIDRQQESLIIKDPEREKNSSQYFSYLMLFLGIVVGSVIGAMLYFIVPGAGLSSGEAAKSAIVLDALVEADQLLRSGRIDSARKAYLDVIAEYPDSPQPYNNLAALYAAEGDFEQAQALLNKALETDPNYLTIYKNVGMIYAAMARDSYGKALQLESQQQQVHLQMLGAKSQQPVVAQDQKEQKPMVPVKPVTV
ncbi:MAG: tetratricopeptide repeat protein, partial [Geopsychrobacter sp.]|nr:tetratricopeptide repeat protein [Geopsychrobacter sp.]